VKRVKLLRGRRAPSACTIVTRNFLSYARVLGESYLRRHPGSHFYVLVVDRLPEDVEAGGGLELFGPEVLDLPYFHDLCFKYDVVELSTAVKPTFLRFLLDREDAIVYLDPDILVMQPLAELWATLRSAPIVLTPHLLSPIPRDGLRPNEQDMLISGAYNLGFLALRRSPDASALLEWWSERLRDDCRIDVANGLFTDQKWIDLVPGYFASTAILRDPTYNVAFWNLHERTVERDGDTFSVGGRPIAFYHFSGFSPARPGILSKHQTRTKVVQGSPLADLLNLYVDLHLHAGYASCSEWEYAYARFQNGIRVNSLLRQLYLDLDEEERRRFGDPFEVDRPDTFYDWATRPRTGGVSRFLERLYRVRYDLPAAFQDIRGGDRDAYVAWARQYGSAEMDFEPELVRGDDAEAVEPYDEAGSNGAACNGRAGYAGLVARVRAVIERSVPPDATVAVISKGDEQLISLEGRCGWHFPEGAGGTYAGYYPPSGSIAVAHLEQLRERGASFLALPSTAFWWLEHYDEFREHLEERYRRVWFDEGCAIYDLTEGT
jgi:hypothetical protein